MLEMPHQLPSAFITDQLMRTRTPWARVLTISPSVDMVRYTGRESSETTPQASCAAATQTAVGIKRARRVMSGERGEITVLDQAMLWTSRTMEVI